MDRRDQSRHLIRRELMMPDICSNDLRRSLALQTFFVLVRHLLHLLVGFQLDYIVLCARINLSGAIISGAGAIQVDRHRVDITIPEVADATHRRLPLLPRARPVRPDREIPGRSSAHTRRRGVLVRLWQCHDPRRQARRRSHGLPRVPRRSVWQGPAVSGLLAPSEWSRLEDAVAAANFWMLDEYGGSYGLDGSTWRFAG